MNNKKSENFNIKTQNIDKMKIEDMLTTINEIDKEIPDIVKKANKSLKVLIEKVVEILKSGGRIIYMGSGHSGDIIHGDAQEMAGTYGVPHDTWRGLHLQLGPNWDWKKEFKFDLSKRDMREDGKMQFIEDLKTINWAKKDLVIGVSASGETPVTIEALKWVKNNGGATAAIVNNLGSTMGNLVDFEVVAEAGPEAISGSTRMKSGTVTKILVNTLSTIANVKMGNVYKGLMVGLRIGPKGDLQKFEERAKKIVSEATGVSIIEAEKLLDLSDNTTKDKSKRSIKVAILMKKLDCSVEIAKDLLIKHYGNIRSVLN